MIGHLRFSSDHIGKFSFDSIYSLSVKKSIYLIFYNIIDCQKTILSVCIV